MSNQVIDRKTEKHSYGVWPVKLDLATTMTLVRMGTDKFGLSYHAKFSGIRNGEVQGGPYEVNGNMEIVVNKDPRIVLKISNFHKTSSAISMTVTITVDIPVIGTQTIFHQHLGGTYHTENAWLAIGKELNSYVAEQKGLAE